MSGQKLSRTQFNYNKFSSISRFQVPNSSFYQSLSFGIIETIIRFLPTPEPTKMIVHRLEEDFKTGMEFCTKSRMVNPAFLDVLQQIYTNTSKNREHGQHYLEQYSESSVGGYALDYGMRSIICALTPGKNELHTEVIAGMMSSKYDIIINTVSTHYSVEIQVYNQMDREPKKFTPTNPSDYPILYLFNDQNSYSILYTEEADQLRSNPNDLILLKSANVLSMMKNMPSKLGLNQWLGIQNGVQPRLQEMQQGLPFGQSPIRSPPQIYPPVGPPIVPSVGPRIQPQLGPPIGPPLGPTLWSAAGPPRIGPPVGLQIIPPAGTPVGPPLGPTLWPPAGPPTIGTQAKIQNIMKRCVKCNQNKLNEEFNVITCDDDIRCMVCSFCKKNNTEQCVVCSRLYTDYEMFLFFYI